MKFPLVLFSILFFSTFCSAQENSREGGTSSSVKMDSLADKATKIAVEADPSLAKTALQNEAIEATQSLVKTPLANEAVVAAKNVLVKDSSGSPLPISVEALGKKAEAMGQNAANKTTDAAMTLINRLPFMQRVWTSGSTNFSFVNSTTLSGINVALSPAFGYKVTPKWSVGPRFEVRYGYMKGVVNYSTTTTFVKNVMVFNTLTYSAAAFTRLKVLGKFFLHGEVGYQSLESPSFNNTYLDYDAVAKKVVKKRDNRPTTYIGVGYNNNGTDMLFLYNLVKQDQNNLFALPFDYRIGFTNNF
jgi:hypothetical protein